MKYELTSDCRITTEGTVLCKPAFRIKALKDFGDVLAGQLGGFITDYSNLSQEGNYWVYDDAIVTDQAIVKDNAKIKGNALISDCAEISGKALVCENASISGEVEVCENAIVCGNVTIEDFSIIKGKADIGGECVISGHSIISGNATLTGSMKVIYSDIKDVTLSNNFNLIHSRIDSDEDFCILITKNIHTIVTKSRDCKKLLFSGCDDLLEYKQFLPARTAEHEIRLLENLADFAKAPIKLEE